MTKIKEVRLQKGLTQKELSEKSGVSIRTLQHYEQGSKNFDHARIDTLLNVCETLKCTLYDILENEDYKEKLKKVMNNFL